MTVTALDLDDEPPAASTEADLTGMLRRKLTRGGNGGSGEYAFLAQVRNAAGFNANRTFDGVGVSLWPSRGFVIHVYEIKVSRSDWLAELRNPAKAEDAARFGDKFSMVVPAGIIRKGELPPTWGQLTVRGDTLIITKEAPYLHELPDGGVQKLPPIPRSHLVPMLRAAGAAAVTPKEIEDARREAYKQAVADSGWKANYETECERHRETREQIRAFEAASGVTLNQWRTDPAQIGEAVKAVMTGDRQVEQSRARIARVQQELREAADRLTPLLDDGAP